MRKVWRFIPFFLLFISFTYTLGTQEPEVLRITDSPFPPYIIGETGEKPEGGIIVDIAEEAFKRAGVRYTMELHPWKRVLRLLMIGKSDAVLLLMKNEEREEYLRFSPPILESRENIYYNIRENPNFTWNTFADLIPYKIGLINGFTYGEDFLEAIDRYSLKVEHAETVEVNFAKLYAGRIDIIVEDQTVGSSLIMQKQEWKERLRAAEKPVSMYEYYMAFSKAEISLGKLEKINQALNTMIEDGTIDKIYRRYTEATGPS